MVDFLDQKVYYGYIKQGDPLEVNFTDIDNVYFAVTQAFDGRWILTVKDLDSGEVVERRYYPTLEAAKTAFDTITKNVGNN